MDDILDLIQDVAESVALYDLRKVTPEARQLAELCQMCCDRVKATVSLLTREEGGFILAVKLSAHLPGLDQATADKLIEATHQVCPYSNSTRGNIDVTLEATI